jgi:colanic acid/amylovoran biosynthesis glycosyltransferase
VKTLAYITATSPLGPGDEFVLREMVELGELGRAPLVFPRDCSAQVVNAEAAESLVVHEAGILSPRVLGAFLAQLARHPGRVAASLGKVAFASKRLAVLKKNLAVFPKAVYLANRITGDNTLHLHVHWGGTTSTMALVVHQLNPDVPWSLTLHRWDITENNLLAEKAASASFIRCISSNGMQEVLGLIRAQDRDKVVVIHMGVDVWAQYRSLKRNKIFTLVTPANLLPVKGHTYLIEALRDLLNRGIDRFRCIFYGRGSLADHLKAQILKSGLSERVQLKGQIANRDLIASYRKGEVDAVVLPSIIADDGQHEGIPVSLMEAMANGVPVISTATGGTMELVSEDCAVVVPQKDAGSLARAIELLMTNEEFRQNVALKGYRKVDRDFNAARVSKTLIDRFASATANRRCAERSPQS